MPACLINFSGPLGLVGVREEKEKKEKKRNFFNALKIRVARDAAIPLLISSYLIRGPDFVINIAAVGTIKIKSNLFRPCSICAHSNQTLTLHPLFRAGLAFVCC